MNRLTTMHGVADGRTKDTAVSCQ